VLAAVQNRPGALPVKLLLLVTLSVCAALGQGSEQVINTQPRLKTDKPAENPAGLTPEELRKFGKPIRSEVDLVLVSVTVTDPLNRLVTGLEKENFVLLEQNIKQDIKHFSSEDAPLSLGVVFDLSTSMKNKIDKAKEAVVEFFKTANPQDEFFMVTFADRPELLHDFTSSIEDIQGKLVYAVPKGQTALLDAVYLAMNRMKAAKHAKRALLVISDGGDNHSRYTDNEIKRLVQESDVQIYAIGIFDPYRSTSEEIRGPYLLAELTDATGGRTFSINDVSELSDTAVKIGVELRNQYVLGYRPSNKVRDGKWRKLKVKLNAPKGLPILNVHARQGYYAPQP
jgi:Ca-activated chloride channel family protein